MAYVPTVYVVDDDDGFRHWCADRLGIAGYAVESFGNGERFLESDWIYEACCLVTDVHLGVAIEDGRPRSDRLSGLDLQCRVRRCDSKLPIIFTGVCVRLRLVCHLFQHGAFDFHEKPVSETDFQRSISVAAARKNCCGVTDQNSVVEPNLRRRIDALTPREFEVLGEMLRGMSIKQLAGRFDISIQTAAKHRARVLNKLRCENEIHVLHLLGRRWHQIFSDIVV